MNANLLKLRLQRIERDIKKLTPEDILMLVTEDEPNLNSGFFSRLFTVNVPNKWEFYICSTQEISISINFASLIETVFIPYYAGYAKRYAWMEQCILFRLKHQSTVNLNQIVNKHLTLIENSENLQLSREISLILYERQPNALTLKTLARVYKKSNFHTDAIHKFEQYFEQYSCKEEDYFDYLECLVARKNIVYKQEKGEFSDLQYALFLMCRMEEFENKARQQALFDHVIVKLLPKEILKTRGESTNIFADMGRGLNQMSKGLGGLFGGRESEIPHSKGIISSAPQLLKNPQIVEYLNQHQDAQKVLKKFLSDKGLKLGAGAAASAYTLGLIWDYSHIDPAFLQALSFASRGNPENLNALQDISADALEKSGAVTRLSGYVAEQQVAMNLQQQGHVVELPTSANQVGYDLIVDGTPMQVKCSMDANYVLSHFDKYPDIPVIVNSELAAKLGDHPMVIVDPYLSYSAVQESTAVGLEELSEFAGIGDVLPIPFITLGMAAYRNYAAFDAGLIDSQKYLENVGKETAAISGGAAVGGLLLTTIAGIATGGVSVIIAGGIGAYIGGVAGSTGANTLVREALCKQRDIVVKLLIDFAAWFNDHLLVYRRDQLLKQLQNFEMHFVEDAEHIVMFSTLLMYQYEAYMRAHHLNQWLVHKLKTGNEMEEVQAGWVALEASGQFLSVELKPKVDEINRQLDIYKHIANPKVSNTNNVLQLKPA